MGKFRAVDEEPNEYMAYLRENESQTVLVLLNFSEASATVDYRAEVAQILFSSEGRTGTITIAGLQLIPFEILILDLQHE